LRGRYLKARRGLDTLRHATPVAPSSAARRFRRAGLRVCALAPLQIGAEHEASLGHLARRTLPLYSRLRLAPGIGRLMVEIGPAFELILEKPGTPAPAGKIA
jgi:hypothetical protein